MVPKEPKISEQAAAGITRDITFTIPETTEIIRKPGSATCQSVITAAQKMGLFTTYGIKTHKEKITCRKLVQMRRHLMNGILNNLAPLQFCWCQIK